MTSLSFDIEGAEVLIPGAGLVREPLGVAEGRIVDATVGRRVDLSGFLVLPGIVDVHGDGFERHLAPRRGAMNDIDAGMLAVEAELSANGITTGVLAQFLSWEGGLRGPDFADGVFGALNRCTPSLATDMRPQLRFETHFLEHYEELPGQLADWGVDYIVFNDHLPHDRLAQGRTPKRMTGQALKAGRSPEAHLALMQKLHAQRDAVPAALDRLCTELAVARIVMGSHDDRSAAGRAAWRARGVSIAEFPETIEAAHAARDGGDAIILGAPNVVRGGSHNGNASAHDLIRQGLCDALASDYHYPSLRRAAFALSDDIGVEPAWDLVSRGPARVLGLKDRGTINSGLRADLLVLEAETHQVAATLAGGCVTFMSGAVAARFFG